jgi:hypothetical protein
MDRSINVIAAVGLMLGGALGKAGAIVMQQNVRAIDGSGLTIRDGSMASGQLLQQFRIHEPSDGPLLP